MEQWENMWLKGLKSTLSSNLKEFFYKMMFRWYMYPSKLAKMYKGTSGNCWKCEENEGTFYHMWWTCMKAKKLLDTNSCFNSEDSEN